MTRRILTGKNIIVWMLGDAELDERDYPQKESVEFGRLKVWAWFYVSDWAISFDYDFGSGCMLPDV